MGLASLATGCFSELSTTEDTEGRNAQRVACTVFSLRVLGDASLFTRRTSGSWRRLSWRAGCRQDMHDQPKYIPLRRGSSFFADDRSARPPVPGTVARGQLHDDALLVHRQDRTARTRRYFRSRSIGAVMARGQERFNIYCSPCHGRTGLGDGMIVRRGYRQSAVVSRRPPARGAGRTLLRRDDQRFRRDARLRGADQGRGSLGDRRVHPRAAVERARDDRGCAGRPAGKTASDAVPRDRRRRDSRNSQAISAGSCSRAASLGVAVARRIDHRTRRSSSSRT